MIQWLVNLFLAPLLSPNLPPLLDTNTLTHLWPRCDKALIDGIVNSSTLVLAKYELATPLVLSHFMAQISHECGAGTEIVENLDYESAARIAAVWPSRFTVESAKAFVHNPKALADKVYNGRMGNAIGTDDGWNYRGRGATQCTGRDEYAGLANKTGIDLLNNPSLINDNSHFLECGAADFVLCGCLPFAQKDDLDGVTFKLNGGHIGLMQRAWWLQQWKAALGITSPQKPKPQIITKETPHGLPTDFDWA